MVTDFYFADIGVGISIVLNEDGQLGNLTEDQLSALRQVLYLGLNTFAYTRALFLLEADKIPNIPEAKKETKDNKQDGG